MTTNDDWDFDDDWQDEWQGMPEFVQESQKPYAQIIVRFDDQEGLDEFSRLIGQHLTNRTKSIWHPQLQRGANSTKRYISDEP